jgi:hypothetical protein
MAIQDYRADFYIGDQRICCIYTPCKDEEELYKYLAEPLYRHGCEQGHSFLYQKAVFEEAFTKLLKEKDLCQMDMSALTTTFLLLQKFKDPRDLNTLIIKDKFQSVKKDAVRMEKNSIRDTISKHVSKHKHSQERFETRSRKRTRKARRF